MVPACCLVHARVGFRGGCKMLAFASSSARVYLQGGFVVGVCKTLAFALSGANMRISRGLYGGAGKMLCIRIV